MCYASNSIPHLEVRLQLYLWNINIFVTYVLLQQTSMVDSPASSLRSNRSSVYESRKSIHLADGAEFEPVPDLTNFRPVTLTVSSFFKQVILKFWILLLRWLDWILRGDTIKVWVFTPRTLTKSWKKDTTVVLYKDENLLWFMFHWHRSCHGNVKTPLLFFKLAFVFINARSSFFPKTLKGARSSLSCLDYGKVWTNFITAFWKYFETKFSGT